MKNLLSNLRRLRVRTAGVVTCALLALAAPAFAGPVRLYQNNQQGQLDTNVVVVTAISSNILANGLPIAQGIPFRLTNNTSGVFTNTFQPGWYRITNSTTRSAYVINVWDAGDTVWDKTNVLESGYNTYVKTVYGTNPPPSFQEITNAIGGYYATSNNLYTASNSLQSAIDAIETTGGGLEFIPQYGSSFLTNGGATNLYGPSSFYHNGTNFTIYGTNTTNIVSSANTNQIWVHDAGTTAANGLYSFMQNISAVTVYSNSTHFLRFDPDDLDYQNHIGAWATITGDGSDQLYGNFQQAGDISTWVVINGASTAPTTYYGTNYSTNVYKTFELTGLPMPLAATSTNVLYVSPDGNDATAIRGRTDRPWLRADIAASDGNENDTIFLLPGVHILTNGIYLQRGQKLIGAGKEVTKVKSSVSFAVSAAIVPADNTTVADMTVENVLCCDPSQVIYGYPSAIDPVGYTNALITRCRFFGGSDLTMFGGTNSVQLTIEDSEMRGFWDGQTFTATAVTNYVNIRRSHLWQDARTNNLLSSGHAIIVRQPLRLNLEDVHIRVDSTNASDHAAIRTTGLASGAIITINGGSITVTNSSSDAIDNQAGSTINVANCKMDTTKVVGTVNYLVDPATLGSGSSITTKYLRGDSTWQTVSGGASIDDTAFASSWNGVTTIGPSKNVVYDWGHLLDTDDDGKVNTLDSDTFMPVPISANTSAQTLLALDDSTGRIYGGPAYNGTSGLLISSGFNATGLTASRIVLTDGSKNLTSAAASSGIVKFDGSTATAGTDYVLPDDKTGTHASPSTSNPLSPTWSGPVHTVWYGATGTINLPAASTYANRGIIIYNTGAFTITIDSNSSEVIVRDGTVQTGGVSITLSSGAGNYVSLICDGARWITLGYKGTLAQGS